MIVVLVLLLVVALAGGAEAYLRHRVTTCLAQSVSTAVGGSVDVGLSPRPLLLTLVDGTVPYLTVDSDNAAFGAPGRPQITDLRFRSRFDGLHLPGSDGSVGYVDRSTATIDWPVSSISSTVRAQSFGGLVTQVTTEQDTLRVQFLGGVGSVAVRPVVRSDRIAIETVDARVLGVGIPANVVQQLVALLSGKLAAFPLGLEPTSVQVNDDGLEVMLAGGRADLPERNGNAGNCSRL